MMKRLIALICVLVSAMVVVPREVEAQTPFSVTYPAGWSMVGAPAGTDFSAATPLYAYAHGAYTIPSSRIAKTCQGYWANFPAQTKVTFANPPNPGRIACPLEAGWNLIGNPFPGMALLPGNFTAYIWSGGQYVQVTSLLAGQGAWVYSDNASSVTLDFQSTALPPTPDLIISDLTLPGTQTYTVHVGQTVELLLTNTAPLQADFDTRFLQTQDAGISGPLSCVGDPSCSLSFVNRFWIWKAIAQGTTQIYVSSQCIHANPPCSPPPVASVTITLNILP